MRLLKVSHSFPSWLGCHDYPLTNRKLVLVNGPQHTPFSTVDKSHEFIVLTLVPYDFVTSLYTYH